jgi:hypothetical protein
MTGYTQRERYGIFKLHRYPRFRDSEERWHCGDCQSSETLHQAPVCQPRVRDILRSPNSKLRQTDIPSARAGTVAYKPM